MQEPQQGQEQRVVAGGVLAKEQPEQEVREDDAELLKVVAAKGQL